MKGVCECVCPPRPGGLSNIHKDKPHKSTRVSAHVESHTHLQPPPTHADASSVSLLHTHTHTHSAKERLEKRRVCLSGALVPGFPDQWCVAGWSMWGLSGVERANGQVSGLDTSWLPLPITTSSVNRPHHTPLLLSHTHTDTHREGEWGGNTAEHARSTHHLPTSCLNRRLFNI